MNRLVSISAILVGALTLSSCSLVGHSGVETAAYEVLKSEEPMEIRHYSELVIVSAPMRDEQTGENGAFRQLFKYITGSNSTAREIEMTAPVFMDRGKEEGRMSFVLPARYSLETAPEPNDPTIRLSRITDATFATITFDGRLRDENVGEYREQLMAWLGDQAEYQVAGSYFTAAYNPPWTLPMMRRNEVFVPVRPRRGTETVQ